MAGQLQNIAVDDNSSDSGSGYMTGSEYSTESLTSSIYGYRFENGRRYHAYKDGKYLSPNDEKEQDRLDIFHHICLLILDGELHTAPIGKNPQTILDIGTGTGIWAIDMGERYPSAQVIGTDLSPIQPSWVPPNVEFQIDDAEVKWTWPEGYFDLVHLRHLGGAIKDWDFIVKEAFRVTKPGGWVEICEYDFHLYSDDDTYHEGLNLWKYYDLVNLAAAKEGRLYMATVMGPILEASGFEDVTVKMLKLPFGTWPADPKMKEIGAYFMLAADSGFEALGMAYLTRVLGMKPDEVMELIGEIKKECKSRKVHSYGRQYFYHAQKPEKLEDVK